MKKILIIGATGQLGSALIKRAKVFGVIMLSPSREEFDITNTAQVKKSLESIMPDVVINTASYHLIRQCEESPKEAFKVNCEAVYTFAKHCKKIGARFITYSTNYVFDGRKGNPYHEDDIVSPLQMYAISKVAGEYATISAYPEGGFIIRTSTLYGGEGSRSKGGNFIVNILKEAETNSTIKIRSELINPTFAGDLANATLELLSKEAEPGIYHLVSEGHTTWKDFLKEIFTIKEIAREVELIKPQEDFRRPSYSVLENIKAKRLGVVLPAWQDGLRSYFYGDN